MSEASALDRVRKQWTALGESDPLWAVLTRPEKTLGRWDEAEFFETGVREVEGVIETARKISRIQFGTAVDFGCGVGRLSQALAARFDSVIGIDISESMIREANRRNRFSNRCRYVHNFAADLAVLPSASANLVYSSITLQHIDPSLSRVYIREFFRVAKPCGLVIFQLPSRPRSRVRQIAKSAVPITLRNLLWRIRSGCPEAIEAHFIPEDKVRDLVNSSGGSAVLVESNEDGPLGWASLKYFCVRDAWV